MKKKNIKNSSRQNPSKKILEFQNVLVPSSSKLALKSLNEKTHKKFKWSKTHLMKKLLLNLSRQKPIHS